MKKMTDSAEVNQKEADALKLFVVLNRAQEAVSKQAIKDIKKYGLNLTEFAVLELLYNKGPQPIQMIGKNVLLASSSITYVVDKLEKRHLIERAACPNDRRVTHARLTSDGETLMKTIFPQHKEALTKLFDHLTSEEQTTAIHLLKKIGLSATDK